MEITKSEFGLYEAVRRSGVVNMMFVSKVAEITDLSVEEVKYIIRHYEALSKKFGDENV